VQLSRYMVVLCAIWVIAMAWRLYPQFKDTPGIDGRVISYADYVAERCGESVRPAAATCVGEARRTGRRLVARQQAKSLLLIEAPLSAYLLIHAPLKTSSPVWRAMDQCADAAQKTYRAHATREAARQKCLDARNLPGDASVAPASQQPVQ